MEKLNFLLKLRMRQRCPHFPFLLKIVIELLAQGHKAMKRNGIQIAKEDVKVSLFLVV
jgi:hypothetical protein